MSDAYRFTILASLLLLSLGLTSRPALAQVDLSGKWGETLTEDEPDLFPGPEIGDYTEMPINDAARMRADTWDAQKLEMIEHECDPHGATYAPFGLMFRQDLVPFTEAVAAWEVQLDYMHEKRTIYMDGRPHPPASAPHTWEGFSTGEWEGDMLRVTVTHMKEAFLRRNGLPRSEKATFIQYFIPHHRCRRPRLSDGAVHSKRELCPRADRTTCSALLPAQRRRGASRGLCRLPLAR
jgi:hypothetical protein